MAQNDFYFQPGQTLDLGTPKQRFANNKQAIQLAKELASTRCTAEPDELAILSKYVGWGDSRLASRVHELTDLLTEDELRSARGSTLNAHYTALPVIGAMWEAALQFGFGERPFRAFDPSAGIGHFKSMTPESLSDKVDWTEIELDGLTATILKALHPNSRILTPASKRRTSLMGCSTWHFPTFPLGITESSASDFPNISPTPFTTSSLRTHGPYFVRAEC